MKVFMAIRNNDEWGQKVTADYFSINREGVAEFYDNEDNLLAVVKDWTTIRVAAEDE